ncbi:MAG TPA: DUF928 domain-containing protein, partial [Trichocoleus sp.]
MIQRTGMQKSNVLRWLRLLSWGATASLLVVLLSVERPAQAGFDPPPTVDAPIQRTQAGGTRAYQPPPGADAPTSPATGGGRRGGCQGTGDIDLLTLAPRSHIGQTMQSHPTLVWFAPADIRQPLELEVYEKNAAGQWQRLQSFTLESGSTGLMSFTWPQSEPGLTVGQTYRWQVVSTCVAGLPSRDLVATAQIQVVAPPADLTLPADAEPLQAAQAYAAAGLWYDALSALTVEPV